MPFDKTSDVRQRKVRELIRDEFEGKLVAFADAIGRPDNYVSRIVTAGPNRKGIGERMARHIEQRCRKPRGWLDDASADARVAEAATLYGRPISEEAADVGREWDKLREPIKSQISQLIDTLVAQQVREARRPRRPSRKDDKPDAVRLNP